MPRPTRASRKPPAGGEVEKVSKKVVTTTGKKEKKTAEKEVVEKPGAPPVRATRSRGMVELVVETSQASQATVTSTRTSPDKPTTARRRGQSQQPVALVAEITTFPAATSPPKRSTRATANPTTTTASIVIEEVVRETPSPKKPTRATMKVSLHKKQESNSRVAAAPPTPEITPLSPEIQVPASSDAENHSPASSPHFASSPPAIMGTAPRDDEEGPTTPTKTKDKGGKQKRISLEFAEDEGYTPPRARPSSAERPRLRELGVESLEPLDRLPGIDENDVASSGGFAGDDEDEPASPTPKRASRWKLSQLVEEEEEEAGEEADLEDNDEVPASAQPERQPRKKRFGSPFQLQTGKKDTLPTAATVTAMEVEDMTFAIYSDPNTPSPTLPDTTNARELDEIMRPPLSSSPAQESPRHSRKRRSSSVDMGSDEDSDRAEEHPDQTRGGKRRKQAISRSKLAAKPKQKVLQTEDLCGLLPKRKGRGRHTEKDEFDLPPSEEEEEEEDEDELSKPTKRKSKPTRKSKSKTKSKSTAPTTTAKITKSAWSRPLVPAAAATTTTAKKTYARKSTGSGKENEAPRMNKGRNDEDPGEEEEEAAATTTSGTVVELADGILGKEGRRKLRDAAEKFRVVDAWEMEFEDVSASPS